MKIIALKSIKYSGKTTTIKLLCDEHLDNLSDDYSVSAIVDLLPSSSKEYKRVYTLSNGKKEYKVGICSEGDTGETLTEAFREFNNHNCDIAVVACRTKGKSFDTVIASSSADLMIISKSVDYQHQENYMANLNAIDAKRLCELLSYTMRNLDNFSCCHDHKQSTNSEVTEYGDKQ